MRSRESGRLQSSVPEGTLKLFKTDFGLKAFAKKLFQEFQTILPIPI
jgi:hypothetical protein